MEEIVGTITCGIPAPPWGNWQVHYAINLYPPEETGKWSASISFDNRNKLSLTGLNSVIPNTMEEIAPNGIYTFVTTGPDFLNDSFANQIAEVLRDFIVEITPIVNDFGNDSGEENEL